MRLQGEGQAVVVARGTEDVGVHNISIDAIGRRYGLYLKGSNFADVRRVCAFN